jgi:hypothetical protein
LVLFFKKEPLTFHESKQALLFEKRSKNFLHVVWWGLPAVCVTEMLPPQVHLHVLPLSAAGMPAMVVVLEAGLQGAAITGRQGIGVCTPMAAAVAAITMGFVEELHMPKVMILTRGVTIIVVATGMPATRSGVGVPSSAEAPGGSACEHLSMLPMVSTACISDPRSGD